VRVVERDPKTPAGGRYGRAITLFPRSAELLDQMGVAAALAQSCFACRSTVSYDAAGNEVRGRGWFFMESMGRGRGAGAGAAADGVLGRGRETVFDFALVLRQKYQEDIFRTALAEKGVLVEAPWELVGLDVADVPPADGCRVTARLKNESGQEKAIRCKYLIGADGGRSTVRRLCDIPFDGSSSEDKWVRIDGVIETDLPKPRTYCAIESPTHGNVLWAALDHGATRIGFAFTKDREKGYEVFNEEAAVKEAQAAVKPFKLHFKQVDWWTIYVVGQRVARTFSHKNCVFLAGDACHTHSSGAAQGMNTGMHDSVNLAWKLSLVLQGKASPNLLHTYEAERKPNVEKLINYDKDISRLMTMQLPLDWKGDPKADPNEVLGVVMKEAASFSSGLGIDFQKEALLNVQGSFVCGDGAMAAAPGKRVPDVQLLTPATFEITRMHRVTPNVGRFYVVIFTGDPAVSCTTTEYGYLAGAVNRSSLFADKSLPLSWLTICATNAPSAYELLGGNPLGKVYFDRDGVAHERYGVDASKGAIFVFRPDGWIGTAVKLGGSAVQELIEYFANFLGPIPEQGVRAML